MRIHSINSPRETTIPDSPCRLLVTVTIAVGLLFRRPSQLDLSDDEETLKSVVPPPKLGQAGTTI